MNCGETLVTRLPVAIYRGVRAQTKQRRQAEVDCGDTLVTGSLVNTYRRVRAKAKQRPNHMVTSPQATTEEATPAVTNLGTKTPVDR